MRSSISLLVFVVASTQAWAQDSTSVFVKFADWTKKHGTSIRKTFEGSSKDENKPATFFWNRDFKEDVNYHTIDVGVKIMQFEWFKNTDRPLVLFPKFEWHTDNRDEARKYTIGGGANLEYYPIPAKPPGAGGADGFEPRGWATVPWLQGSVQMKEDRVLRERTTTLVGFLSLFSLRDFLPGDQLKVNGMLVFRYYPYFGTEFYKAQKEDGGEALLWSKRIFFELWPIPIKGAQYLQLTFDYTHRSPHHDSLYEKGSMEWLAAGLNFYPDGKGKIGVGLEYSSGDDSNSNFVFVRKLSFGLKINY